MRLAHDLILVICAIISTVCLVYLAINLDITSAEDADTPAAPTVSQDSKS